MSIARYKVKVVDDLAFVPDVIAGGNDIDVEFEQFLGEGGRDAESGGGVFPVRDDQVDVSVANDSGQPVFDNGSAGTPKNVADEKNSHECLFDGNREWFDAGRANSAFAGAKSMLFREITEGYRGNFGTSSRESTDPQASMT